MNEVPSPWLWERLVFACGGFVTDELLYQLMIIDPKARQVAEKGGLCVESIEAECSGDRPAETSSDTAKALNMLSDVSPPTSQKH